MLIEVSKLSNLSASIASRVYPNNSLSEQLVQSGGTRDRGVNIVSVPTKSGRLATMGLQNLERKGRGSQQHFLCTIYRESDGGKI